jgi:tetratricopeptide (TPR) repeat protein
MTTDTAVETPAPGVVADEGEVLITIGTSDSPGIIRRWGTVGKAVGDRSLEAIVRGAVDVRVLELVRQKRPAQYESESRVAEEIKGILDRGYRIFVHDEDTPIDSSQATHLKARELLRQATPEYETQAFFTLHLVLEPYSQAADARSAHEAPDTAEADEAGSAFAHELAGEEPISEAPSEPQVYAPDADDEVVVCGEETEEPSQPQPEEPEAEAPAVKMSKEEVLREQFADKIKALDMRGLFVGNFGFQKEAVVDVSRLSTLSPQTVSAYLMKANSFRQSGEYEKALSYYRVLLKSDPDNADFRFLYGKTLLEMGRSQAAVECLQRAKELGHESAQRELDRLAEKQTKKPGLHFLRFWRRNAEAP